MQKNGRNQGPGRPKLVNPDKLVQHMCEKYNILKKEMDDLNEREIQYIAREKLNKAREKEMKFVIKANNKTIAVLQTII